MDERKTMIEACRIAGDYLMQNFRKDKSLLKKRGMSKEIITEYDKQSDKLIIDRLSKDFPNHNLLTEETGRIDRSSQFTWIVDSMDGSGNFAAGNPFFSVSVALVKEDKPVLAAIYAPFLDEFYTAEQGKGAFLGDSRLEVSDISDTGNAYVVACEGGSKTNERLARLYGQIYPKVKDMRKLGSAAIESGFVATMRADCYITLEISPWDVAAGVLIAREAGGIATDFKGDEWKPAKSDLLITNARLHKQFLSLLSSTA